MPPSQTALIFPFTQTKPRSILRVQLATKLIPDLGSYIGFRTMRRFLLSALIFTANCLVASASVDSGLLALAPSDAKVIGAVDVARARSSQLGQLIIARIEFGSNTLRLFSETGFDPRRDIQDVLFAVPADSNSSVILARATFNPMQMEGVASAHGGSLETYRGVNIILDAGRKEDSAIAFPGSGIMVFGHLAAVERVIRDAGAPSALDPALRQLISAISPANDAWVASAAPISLGAAGNPRYPGMAQAMQAIEQGNAGLRFGELVQLTANAVTDSPESALAIATVVRGLVAVAQLQHGSNPYFAMLASAGDSMNLTTGGNTVHLTMSVPQQTLIQLANQPVFSAPAPHVH
jgi:hypothetical protein